MIHIVMEMLLVQVVGKPNNGEIIGDELRELLRKDLVIQKEVERPEGVGGG